MRPILCLGLLCILSCGPKQDKNTATTASTPTPAAPTRDTVSGPKTLQTYFEAYKKAHVMPDDSVVIKRQEGDYIRFDYFPLSGEIIGVTTVQLGLLKTEGQGDKILVFTHSCVEGSCNIDLSALKCYSADWKEESDALLPLADIRSSVEKELIKAQKSKATRSFDHFIVHIKEQSFDLELIKGSVLERGEDVGDMEGRLIQTYYWNAQTQKFSKDYPYAG